MNKKKPETYVTILNDEIEEQAIEEESKFGIEKLQRTDNNHRK